MILASQQRSLANLALALCVSLSVSACCQREEAAAPPPKAAVSNQPATAAAPPATYPANLTEGFKFSSAGQPNFLTALTGLSGVEDWGRWSDGKVVTLQFAQPLPTHFTLQFVTRAFGPNVGVPVEVKAGSTVQTFTQTDAADQPHSLEFKLAAPSDRLEFHIPNPTTPASLNAGNDPRLLGLGFVNLKITTIP